MKSLAVLLGCLFATVSNGTGQGVTLGLSQEQEHFLGGETLMLTVHMTNFSGQTLQFGRDNSWLTFTVENSDRFAIGSHGTVPVAGEFTLNPSEVVTRSVNLAPYYDLTKVGRYYVTALVSLPQWGRVLQSKATSFDIIGGNKIWEKDFGVPNRDGRPGDLPEVRKYALIQTSHLRTLRLYFRLTDAREERIFTTYPLGTLVSFSDPDPKLDQFMNLHVLYQNGGRTFCYCLVNPDGLLICRETYESGVSRPVLRAQENGRYIVVGGTRRPAPTDLPPPSGSPSLSDAKLGQP